MLEIALTKVGNLGIGSPDTAASKGGKLKRKLSALSLAFAPKGLKTAGYEVYHEVDTECIMELIQSVS